jgi:cell division GTPase FtsZ
VKAHGYNEENINDIMDDIDELEGSVVLIHSLAGGTGSGLGSRIIEEIRDLYPKIPICTISIAACQSGETG